MMYYILICVISECDVDQLPTTGCSCREFNDVVPAGTALYYGTYDHTLDMTESTPYATFNDAYHVSKRLTYDNSVVKLTVVDSDYVHVHVITHDGSISTSKVDL